MIQKLKKKSGRTMQENWSLGRRKSVAVGLLSSFGWKKENNIEEKKEEEEQEEKEGKIQRSFSLSQII